jgi:hypothetical protein
MARAERVFIKMKSLQIDVVNDSPHIPMSDTATKIIRALLGGGGGWRVLGCKTSRARSRGVVKGIRWIKQLYIILKSWLKSAPGKGYRPAQFSFSTAFIAAEITHTAL